MKIGDKVRFLNEVGGGTIVGFQGHDIALVEDGDGFSIPMALRDIVAVETDDYNVPTRMQKKKKQAEVEPEVIITPSQMVRQDLEEAGKAREVKGRDLLSVYLCFVPDDIRQVTTTSFTSYLVNDSNFCLFYTFSNLENGSLSLRSSGLMEPNTKVVLEAFDRSVLNSLERVTVQLLAFKPSRLYSPQPAVSKDLRIDTVKFYKLHTFVPTDFFDTPALVYEIIRDGAIRQQIFLEKGELERSLMEKRGADETEHPRPRAKKREKDGIVEVDLHISELVDSQAGLSNADMLQLQLDRFRQVMKERARTPGQRIVFIHGKGEGVLRKAILDELRRTYPRCKVQDASFQEYGFGATMVTVVP